VTIDGAEITMPELHEAASHPQCALGVRPEHVRLSDGSPLRGSVYGTEYLGTTQIVTVATGRGFVKARLPSETSVWLAEPVGLTFRPEKLSIFDRQSGRVLRSALHDTLHEGDAHG
jgi:multiple sugar transport system ATP-binding protein